jgi:hypothetical protein
MTIAAILWAAEVAWSQQPSAPDAGAQFAYIRPTYRLTGENSRTVRPAKPASGAALKKSGNISPLRRELPKSIAHPPKTRRREIPW